MKAGIILALLAVTACIMSAGCIQTVDTEKPSDTPIIQTPAPTLPGITDFERTQSMSKLGSTSKNEIHYTFTDDKFSSTEEFIEESYRLVKTEFSLSYTYPITKIDFKTKIGGTEHTITASSETEIYLDGQKIDTK